MSCYESEPSTFIEVLLAFLIQFKVHISDAESKAGLQISPAEKVVTVTNRPVLDVVFSQFRAKVSGQVTCIGKTQALISMSFETSSDSVKAFYVGCHTPYIPYSKIFQIFFLQNKWTSFSYNL